MAAAAKPRSAPLDAVVGGNVRRLRELLGATLDDVAQALSDRGWRASAPMLLALERGERAVRLDETFRLADALGVAVADLLETAGNEVVDMGWPLSGSGRQLAERLTKPPRPHGRLGGGRHSAGDEAVRVAERHAAERLGVSPDEIVRRSYARWGRTLTEERNARAEARVAEIVRRFRDEVRRATRSAEGDARVEDRRELALSYVEAGVAEGTVRQRAALRAHVTRELLAELEDEPLAAKEAKRVGNASKEKGRKR